MKKLGLLTLLLLITGLSFAQFTDDFSDGNFTTNPVWSGQTDNFAVNGISQLQLFDDDASHTVSSLVTAVETADSTNWSFYVQLDFSPSTSNFAKIYLSSNNADLSGNLDGYFVKIGGITGAEDAIELYKQTGSSEELLIAGNAGGAGGSKVEAWIQVKRDNTGKFDLLIDYIGDGDYDSMGVYFDGNAFTGKYFGWECTYSATRKDKFYLDDIIIDPVFADDTAPSIVSVQAISSTEIDILFDEDLGDISNATFSLSPSITVMDKMIDSDNTQLVHLILANDLESGVSYEISIDQIQDNKGNIATVQLGTFEYTQLFEANPFDIIINEIMADPTPAQGLPDVEYLELFNRTDKNISLDGYKISTGTAKPFNSVAIPANSYLIVCDQEDVAKFTFFGNVVGVVSMPALTNGGDEVELIDANGTLIDRVEYSTFMYNGMEGDGGISLERKNPNNLCDQVYNWSACTLLVGGTPGTKNSILETNTDFDALNLTNAVPIGNNQLQLVFNKNIDQSTFSDLNNFNLEPNVPIANIIFEGIISNTLTLQFSTALEPGQSYTLSFQNMLEDCIGNPIAQNISTVFGLPESVGVGDLVINEILFNPATGGSDFVEVYNRSDKIIDIADLYVSNSFTGTNTKIEFHSIIQPKDYIVLTSNINDIEQRYGANINKMLNISLPSFTDKEGNITLSKIQNGSEVIIDAFDYLDDYHSETVDIDIGVSLERIDPNGVTQDENNWHSAAASEGFGTPTKVNSQYFVSEPIEKEFITLPYSTFSPDSYVNKDFLLINYKVDGPGYTINSNIYDVKGRLVKDLFSNYNISVEGSLQWDGITDEQKIAPTGIYILWLEFVLSNGTVKTEKIPIVLAKQLN